MVNVSCPSKAIFRAAPLLRVVTRNRLIQLSSAYLVAMMSGYEVVAPLEVKELIDIVEPLCPRLVRGRPPGGPG